MEKFDVIVIGGGPGGYLCAERAAHAGLKSAVIEKRALGGTCLNEGCIPTKSLLYCAKQYASAKHGADYGVHAENVQIDHAAVIDRKNKVVKMLVGGVGATMKANGVKVYATEGKIKGRGETAPLKSSRVTRPSPATVWSLRPAPSRLCLPFRA